MRHLLSISTLTMLMEAQRQIDSQAVVETVPPTKLTRKARRKAERERRKAERKKKP